MESESDQGSPTSEEHEEDRSREEHPKRGVEETGTRTRGAPARARRRVDSVRKMDCSGGRELTKAVAAGER